MYISRPWTRPIPSRGLVRTLPPLAWGLSLQEAPGRADIPLGRILPSTPARGGGPLGGFRLGLTLAPYVARGGACFEIAPACPGVLAPADRLHRMSCGLSCVRR